MLSCRCAPLLLALVVSLPVACSSSEFEDGGGETKTATSSSGGTDGTGASEPTTSDDAGTSPATSNASDMTAPTTGETATTGEPAGSSSTGEGATCEFAGVYDCCCFSVEGDPGKGIVSISCPNPGMLCEAPQATCPEGQTDCDAATLTVVSAEGLECVLQALAAGTPGAVSWGVTAENGLNGSNHTLFIQEDGTVLASSYEYKELAYTYTAVERRARQTEAFFTDCIAKATDVERFDCLRQATMGDATETCVDGFSGMAGED
jgi:hypothetical protein